STALAVRLSLLSAGIWWVGFALITFALLRTHASQKRPIADSYIALGFSELGRSLRTLRRLPHTLRYLLAYMAFNDGIQTVISISSVFLAQELFVARGRPVNESFLMGLILMVQLVAVFGSLIFAWIAAAIGTKRAILLSLALWTAIVVYAYGFLE